MEDNIKIELLTPLTGNFTSRELERQWEEGEYEYDVYEGLPLEGADLSQYESEIKEAIEKSKLAEEKIIGRGNIYE